MRAGASYRARPCILIRRLTNSDLGLFYAKRPQIQSKQRAININSEIVSKIFDTNTVKKNQIIIRCLRNGSPSPPEERPLLKSGKNWRLGGKAIRDKDLDAISSGDYFVGLISVEQKGQILLRWQIISAAPDSAGHQELTRLTSSILHDSMAVVVEGEELFEPVRAAFIGMGVSRTADLEAPAVSSALELCEPPAPGLREAPPRPLGIEIGRAPRKRSIRERIRSPHIMEEMLQVAGGLSGKVQQEFFEQAARLAELLRDVLVQHKLILAVPRDHKSAWAAVKDKLIAHVDGGVANLPALGAAPIAIRVGTYLVRPGRRGDDRESFRISPQLVDELFEASGRGVFNGLYPDIGAVRDAARMATEAAGAVHLLEAHPELEYLLIHGALVNPVSRYSDMEDDDGQVISFPEFSRASLERLVPFMDPKPAGEPAQFIPVYLQQLLRLTQGSSTVCGVVERPGPSTSVCEALLMAMPDHTLGPLIPDPPPKWRQWFLNTVKRLGVSDSLLLRCVLEEGEVTLPVAIDRNELRRAPPKWKQTIARYPMPFVSFLLPSEWVGPIRAEIFEKDVPNFASVADFLMHSSMLLPGYAFPVGLDTADKFAKIPNWMGRPVTARMMVSALKVALDSGDHKQIDALRHLLCGTQRDFFFRPKP